MNSFGTNDARIFANVEQLADLADQHREAAGDSKRQLANDLDRKRPNITRALNRPDTRDLHLIRVILKHYGVDTESTPYYRIIDRSAAAEDG
jgi:hypothetical protein